MRIGREWRRGAAALGVAGLLGGCASRGDVVPPSPGPPSAGARAFVVTLAWTAPVDLDLYVTDPAGETVYYANPRARSGGRIERDARCAEGARGPRTERIRWTEAPPGRYRVGVDFPEACGGRLAETAYRLTVDVGGRRVETVGQARLAERVPLVREFDVPGASEGAR